MTKKLTFLLSFALLTVAFSVPVSATSLETANELSTNEYPDAIVEEQETEIDFEEGSEQTTPILASSGNSRSLVQIGSGTLTGSGIVATAVTDSYSRAEYLQATVYITYTGGWTQTTVATSQNSTKVIARATAPSGKNNKVAYSTHTIKVNGIYGNGKQSQRF